MPFKGSKQRLISDIDTWNKACAGLLREALEHGESLDEACNRVMPKYIPGLHLFPKTEHGFWGHIDVAFWAAFLYPLSSFFYILSSPRTIFPVARMIYLNPKFSVDDKRSGETGLVPK